MAGQDAWAHYQQAMRDHLAHNERLADRLRYFVGDGIAAPAVDIRSKETGAWLDLLLETERVARRHREALEALLKTAQQ